MNTKDYRYLGDRSAVQGYTVGLSCHHCQVTWGGCAAECCCPECGAPKGYHEDDRDKCYCDKCNQRHHELQEHFAGRKVRRGFNDRGLF